MEDIRLSIDAYTLDRAAGKQRVRSIEQDGTLVYATPYVRGKGGADSRKPAGAEFADEVERLWTEYPDGLLDITEGQLEALPAEDEAVKKPRDEVVDKEEEERDPGRLMTAEEMEALRSEVFLQLNDARNELWYVLELAKTLALSTDYTANPPPYPGQPAHRQANRKPVIDGPSISLQPGVEPPILPPGTFSATAANTPAQPALNVHDLQLALAAKQEALEECSALIDGAVEELQAMSEAGDRFWQSVRELRDGKGGRGQWAVVPRPDFGRVMTEGERAKDVIIPYALDEAPPGLRARSLAAFDLDPAKLDALTFGARTHQRLRVTLHDHTGLRSSMLASEPGDGDIGALMEAVQAEAVDEDLFNELRGEAIRSDFTVEPRRIVVTVGDVEAVFEMVSIPPFRRPTAHTDKQYDTRHPPTNVQTSPQADLILQLAHLPLLRLHRHRKAQLIAQASKLAPNLVVGPPILAPILQGLRYHQMVQSVRGTLAMFAKVLEDSGANAEVETQWSAAGTEDGGIWTGGESKGDLLEHLEGRMQLKVEEMPGLTLVLYPTRLFQLKTSKSTFPLSDPSSLPGLIAADLELQLLQYAERFLLSYRGTSESEQKGLVFFDELDEVIALPDATLSFAIPAPYSTLRATLEPYDTALPVHSFDGKEMSLETWLADIAGRM